MNSINAEVYSDVSIIINMMPNHMRNKISNNFIEFIEKNKSDTYISEIKPTIPIREQKIRKETKEMLGIIYRDFLCDEEERNNLIKKEQEEIKNREENRKQKYNLDVFLDRRNNENIEKKKKAKDQKSLIILKEKWYRKIWKAIKKIFNKHKS